MQLRKAIEDVNSGILPSHHYNHSASSVAQPETVAVIHHHSREASPGAPIDLEHGTIHFNLIDLEFKSVINECFGNLLGPEQPGLSSTDSDSDSGSDSEDNQEFMAPTHSTVVHKSPSTSSFNIQKSASASSFNMHRSPSTSSFNLVTAAISNDPAGPVVQGDNSIKLVVSSVHEESEDRSNEDHETKKH